MEPGLTSTIALDLAVSLLENISGFLIGPQLDKIREKVFWERLFKKVISSLISGYEDFEKSEHYNLIAIDQRFFNDSVVKQIFTERILVGDVDRTELRDRFIKLYGEEQVQLFDENLEVAIGIFDKQIEQTLNPGERAAFAKLQSEIIGVNNSIKTIQADTHDIRMEQTETNRLIGSLRDELRKAKPPIYFWESVDVELSEEYKAQLNFARDQINAFSPTRALEILLPLKDRIWEKAANEEKYQILSLMGLANLKLGEISKASQYLIDAQRYKPNNPKAISNAGLGYLLRGEIDKSKELAQRAIDIDPTQDRAYSLQVKSTSPETQFEDILELVPEVYRRSPEVSLALGQVAFDRGLLKEAEKQFRIAVEADKRDYPDLRGSLADSLLASLLKSNPPIRFEGLLEPSREQIHQIIELYDYAWERVSNTELKELRIGWLANRAIAKALLDDINGATKDIDEALKYKPDDPSMIRTRGLLAYKDGNNLIAAQQFQKIINFEETPDARFLLSLILFRDKKYQEAKTLIEKFLHAEDIVSSAREDASRMLVLTNIELGDIEEAKRITDQLLAQSPENPGIIALSALIARSDGNFDEANNTLEKAMRFVDKDIDLTTRFWLIDELYANKKFQYAASLLEEIVDTRIDCIPTRQLVSCYYNAGNFVAALEICQNLRSTFGPLREITNLESEILEKIGDLPLAKNVCQDYLQEYPDDLLIQMRLAVVNYRLKNLNELDDFLRSDIEVDKLDLNGQLLLASFYMLRGFSQLAVVTAYNARRKYLNKPEAHLAYTQIFLFGEKSDAYGWINEEEVNVDVAVRIKSKSLPDSKWMIIENDVEKDIARGEFNTNHPLIAKLIGKRVGDTIIFERGLESEEIEILEIKSKYLYALHEDLDAFQLNFPEDRGLMRFRVELPTDRPPSLDDFKPIMKILDQRQKFLEELEKQYKTGLLPIGSMANLAGSHPIDVHNRLSSNPELGIRCSTGNRKELSEAVEILEKSPKLVIDLLSLMTIFQLGLESELVAKYGKIGITQSTIDNIQLLLDDPILRQRKEYTALGKEKDQYTRITITKEIIEENIRTLENILEWVKINCEVIPVSIFVEINLENRNKLIELIGKSYFDTILVSTKSEFVLFSDDLPLRLLAKTELGVEGVWTQAVLISLKNHGIISEDKYHKALVSLVCLNFKATSINAHVLLEAAKQSDWHNIHPLKDVLRILGGNYSDLKSSIMVAADFIKLLWEKNLPQIKYETIVFAVIDVLCFARQNRAVVIKEFNIQLENRFKLAVPAYENLQNLLRTWIRTHPI